MNFKHVPKLYGGDKNRDEENIEHSPTADQIDETK